MKPFLTSKTIVALAVAIAAYASNVVNAYEQPIPPPAAENALPANIPPGSDLAQVFKLAQAGVELSVIKNFIANCHSRFDLDASKIIQLNDAGIPSNILDLMLEHDRQLSVIAQSPPPVAAPTVIEAPTAAAPAVTVNYFYETLSPYGSWVEVGGYGHCWRPTAVVYDPNWRPYCDRGHWVYTDCGWYWDSDYSWGTTFHYGRWFRDSRFGWCWWPDTTWAPSWVLWRSGEEACGWAPLPPRCFYRQERGFLYNGNNITVGFDFGLNESCFSFVSYNHFFDRHLHDRCEDTRHVSQFYHNTTIVNNYNFNGSRNTVVNNGISVDRFTSATHHPVQPVAVNELPNATRHGWRGEDRNERAPGNSNHSAANTTGYHQTGLDTRNANAGANVALPTMLDHNGQRGHGEVFGNSAAQTGRQATTPTPVVNKAYSQETRVDTTRQAGSAVGQQNQTTQPNLDGYRGQHSSRLEQQQSRGQNPNPTPALVTTPPQRTAYTVEQPQIIHPQTPAQTGQVLERNNNASRWDQPRNQSAAVINTTAPQRSELQVQQPQIVRPSVSSAVLPPSANYMQQRNVQQMENHVYESRSDFQRPANNYQPPVQVQPTRTERAPEPTSHPSSDSHKSDKDKK